MALDFFFNTFYPSSCSLRAKRNSIRNNWLIMVFTVYAIKENKTSKVMKALLNVSQRLLKSKDFLLIHIVSQSFHPQIMFFDVQIAVIHVVTFLVVSPLFYNLRSWIPVKIDFHIPRSRIKLEFFVQVVKKQKW